jgi:branched-chain amino acid transport system permease protein
MCNAVRDNPERAQFVGYNPYVVRFIAFSLAGLFAGIAGGLAAINFELVNSSMVGAAQSGTVLLAAYVGGIGNFIGPVIGAVLVSYLQVMLSDVTEIWQLYFGLLFIGMVMFAPGGIAGLIFMHEPLWYAGAYRALFARLIPAYIVAFVPALIALVGLILIIEMTFRLMVKASEGTSMTFFSVPLDAASAIPWSVAVVLLIGGIVLLRRVLPVVSAAWQQSHAEVQQVRRSRP